MSDLTPTAEADPARNAGGEPSAVRRFITRLSDWFTLQSPLLKTLVVLTLVLIPATGIYSWTLWQKQSVLSADVRAMAAAQPGSEALWALNDKLPVVFGTGSLLGFLESHPVERITVVYRPLNSELSPTRMNAPVLANTVATAVIVRPARLLLAMGSAKVALPSALAVALVISTEPLPTRSRASP